MLTLREELSKTHGIANDGSPFIIAEMSGNHNQSLDRALAIVDAAAETGADAIKIQTFTADSMTLDLSEGEFTITDPKSLWVGRTLYDLYEEAHTPADWHKPIADRAKEHGLLFMSTPFSEDAVDLLESLDAPLYKIASFEAIDLPLIRRVAQTGKPMIISTGMASFEEIDEAVSAARENGATEIAVLHCVSAYPTPPEEANLSTIPDLAARLGTVVGLSDHTMDTAVATVAVGLGASVIEKHVTLARADGGVDSAFSLEPGELARLVRDTRTAHAARGVPAYRPTPSEAAGLPFRRSLYVVADVAAGEPLTEANVRSIRPSNGLAPKHLDQVLGRRASRNLSRGEPLAGNMIEGGLAP